MKLMLILMLMSGCAVNHKASGNIETKGELTVIINYKNCDRPEWSSDVVIECIREASNFEVSVKDAEIIATILRRQTDEQETETRARTNTVGTANLRN
jgi:hypothetical protein